jgi:hypothetical protein
MQWHVVNLHTQRSQLMQQLHVAVFASHAQPLLLAW